MSKLIKPEIPGRCLKAHAFFYIVIPVFFLMGAVSLKAGGVPVDALTGGKENVEIKGHVKNHDGEPLVGATVSVKGSNITTLADNKGAFSLTVSSANVVLIVSYTGYKTKEVSVEGLTVVEVILEPAGDLDDVVVIGYGTQQKKDLTGSIASVKGSELSRATIASTVNALAGRLPGLVVKQTSGQPGFDQSTFNIRNFGSALVIVDGTEQLFNNIDPSQIESISILKDASAAVYGARAGNGVVLITTKRGKTGKTSIQFNTNATGQAYTNFPEPVNAGQYAMLYREAQMNAGIPEPQLEFSEEDIAKYFEGTDPAYPSTNWQNVIMRKWAPQYQHNLSMTGGNEKAKYFTSIGYLNQEGMFKGNNTGYKRYNVRSNLDLSFTSDFSMALDLSVIKEYTRQSSRGGEWFWMDFLDSDPTAPSSYPDKTKIPHISPGPYNAIINTYEELGGYDKLQNTILNGAVSLKYNIPVIKGLDVRAKMNYYQFMQEQKFWRKEAEMWDYDYTSDTYTLYGKSQPTQLSQAYGTNQIITGQFSVNYNRIFGDAHRIEGLLLYEGIDYAGNNFSALRQHYITNAIDQLFAGGTADQMANGGASESGRQSFVGRISYAYKAKYLLQATVRHDGSPIFPKGKQWGTFPGVSAGWVVSEESFLKNNLPWVDMLKLRGSISQTGFDGVSPFQYLSGFRFSGVYVLNGAEVPALTTTGLPNPNITWETMTLSNIGLDFSFLSNKLYGEIDLFQRLRSDMLGSRVASLPNTFGASLPNENINSQRTKGIEVSLGYRGGNRDFYFDIRGNISYSRSKWVHFDEIEYSDPDEIRIYQRSGKWVDLNVGYKSDGLFTTQKEIDDLPYDIDGQHNATLRPGDIKYIDINGDGVLNWRDWVKINDGGLPHIMYGLNTEFRLKRFDLNVLFQGAAQYTVELMAGNINIDSRRTPTKVIWEERWTPENNDRNAIIPRQKLGQTTNMWNSDYWNRNASYLRLKNVSLGYSLRRPNMRVFLSGTNLFTISQLRKYGLDPESPDATRGWTYPIQRTFTIGLNINI